MALLLFISKNLKQLFLIVYLVITFGITGNAQTHVNREWTTEFGYPDTLNWSKSITSSNGNSEIHIGNTKNAQQSTEILITLLLENGDVAWQESYSSHPSHNSYGIDLIESQNNIYVIGVTDNGGTQHDVLLLKYDIDGNLQWVENYNSIFQLNDIPTSLDLDENENIYLCVASESSINNLDYLTLKYDQNGSFLWEKRYDYNDLNDFPAKIHYKDDKLFISGASASSSSRWDYTTILLDASTGDLLDEVRDNVPGIGLDMPHDMKTDVNGNIYLTGKTSTDGINYDIRTMKLDSSLNIIWSNTYDFKVYMTLVKL